MSEPPAYGQPEGPGGYPQQTQPQEKAYPPPGEAYPPAQGYPPGQAPPPAGYAQPGQPGYGQTQTSTVVVTQPVGTMLGDGPCTTTCPHCQAQIVTAVNYEAGGLTWLLCILICCIGCDLGCCFIPFCIDGCKDAIHICPNCHQIVGKRSRL